MTARRTTAKRRIGELVPYVPSEEDKDTQLRYALDLLRGISSVDSDAKK